MQNPYFAQNPSPYAPHVSYDLPPVQSVTSPSPFHYPPAISAPPNPASHTSAQSTTSTTTTAPTPSSSIAASTGNGLPMAHLLQPVSPQHPPLSSAPPYPRSYASSSGSPAEPTAVLPEHTAAAATVGSISGTSGFAAALGQVAHQSHSQAQSQQHQAGSAAAVAAAGLQQKRAYRQRRKDPSCDACRERKVKCDASESSSCTECNNRKVRCQFTKETNRRMSSIKQVQDLEKQLLSTKQQLQQLRSGNVKPDALMDLDFIDATSATGQPGFKLPDMGSRAARRQLQPPAHTVSIDSSVRTNLRTYSQGIWNPPSTSSTTTTTTTATTTATTSSPLTLGVGAPPLPPKPMADHLLSQYHAYVHSTLPVVHWPDFLAEYEQVYRTGSLHGAPRDWAALLFSVLACGALHNPDPNHAEYNRQDLVRIACNVLDMSQDDFGIDRVRASLLISIALYEANSKSACWVWIGTAARLAQELGLHRESVAADRELRRGLWWGVYTWDRLLALEMGKPALINDQDCEVDLPYPSDEDVNTPDGHTQSQGQPGQLPTIQVMRSVGHLTRTLRSSTISASTIDSFERHFETCLGTFPAPYHPKSDLPVDPRFLAPVVYFQNARLLLHRHNLSPLSPTEARSAAFDACLGITLDTANLLSRSLHSSNHHQQQQQTTVFISAASASLCMHIWRCTLLLLFRQQYAAALACVQASALIGDLRVVNTACGRYLAFFLRCLLDRLCRGSAGNGPPDLSRDEELVAYAVGDLHVSSSFDSWTWGSDVPPSPSVTGPASISSPSHSESAASADWEGWEWIERTVQHLLAEQQQQQQQQRPEAGTHELARPNESTFRSPAATGEDAQRSSSHSRMTIASII